MKVLYFTNEDITDWDTIPDIIREGGDEVITITHKFDLNFIKEKKIDFIVSDRARSLITKDIIEYLPKKIINIHPSFLPYNRGYFPNYWSIKTNTPYGVTIHYIDENIDTGDIIAQIRLGYDIQKDTLRTTYDRLRKYSVLLFKICWEDIKRGLLPSFKQDHSKATIHYKKDFDGIYEKLPDGWDTKISYIIDNKDVFL
jgi:methionyl-tRNA formyltransferase